jgi:hypothetical protein
MISDDPLWDEIQTATYLNSSPSTLRKQRMRGDGVPFVKLGASVRYVPAIVQKYVAERLRRSTSERRG